MKINEFDTVKLKDGREGAVVDVYKDGEAFEVEFLDSEGYTASIETVKATEISDVTWRYKEAV